MSFIDRIFGSYSEKELAKIEPIKKKVLDLDEEYKGLSDTALKAKTVEFRERLANGETLDDIMVEALATVREAADRILGKKVKGVFQDSLIFGSHFDCVFLDVAGHVGIGPPLIAGLLLYC